MLAYLLVSYVFLGWMATLRSGVERKGGRGNGDSLRTENENRWDLFDNICHAVTCFPVAFWILITDAESCLFLVGIC